MKYSSPQALLNRYFRGQNKFEMTIGQDISYENKQFVLTHVEGETFELVEKRYSNDIGYYDHEMGCGLLVDLVKTMKGL